MRIAIFTASALALGAIATPALAQDDDKGFTGPRAEVITGWDHVKDDSIYGAKKDGLTYGGALGYDYQIGHAVIGVEGEVTGATTKDRDTNVLVAGDSLKVKAGRDLYAGARVGYAVGNRTLLYVKGGYTNAQIRTSYTSPTTTVSEHDNLDGWRLGAGTEVKLTGNVYAKAEYRYSKYNDGDSTGIDASRHQIVGGVGIRF
ncbi:outer membrane protein [Sphingomonas sp.]|uniref:outer membrane protein n=1 Tax=Sphingomonas sp. TaxID=28214 RepID=UPI001B18B065|nr:outer membrane protein [Sphingomonas sp.]MBO9714390.1 porin family protein [Sphingomonas sp.]